MKLWHIFGGIALSVTLAGCADNQSYNGTGAAVTPAADTATQPEQIAMPSVSGTVNIRQRVALPNNAVLTVTVSDASLSDAPSKVITQRASWTEGRQAPFNFVLPYNPANVQPNARILLSAAVSVDNQLLFITDQVVPVINNGVKKADLLLVPVSSVALPTQSSVPATSPAPAAW
ncbi:hypothetical protein FJU30_12260 [Affinibrenneria salicis]|uniref:Glycoprotein-polysaccharide metabolism protein n=1 Tax=Affinibrenneria salicis TaxID=2590031 RepID=A0A5J5G0H1_9GAMM|nr:YbaY family lipoprotein [Affinibrenneria salicis]KAA9000050.1 hypothetical protein FJU30_12260 [Affinibrenneria salicis]